MHRSLFLAICLVPAAVLGAESAQRPESGSPTILRACWSPEQLSGSPAERAIQRGLATDREPPPAWALQAARSAAQPLPTDRRGSIRRVDILATAYALMWALTWERIPMKLAQALFSISDNPYVILLLINILLLFLGCVMEGTALLIILTPILVPVIVKLGIDPVHFGLVCVINLTISAVTPPVGTILYTVCSIVGVSVEEFTRELWPFLVALVAVLFLVTYFPPTVLWLPNLGMGR